MTIYKERTAPVKLSFVDPFFVYLDLVEQLGAGQAFLLDAAKDAGSEAYQMSIVGALPVLEVQVKDGHTTIHAAGGLSEHLQRTFGQGGFACRAEAVQREGTVTSVLNGEAFVVVGPPMEILEQLRRCVRALFPDNAFIPFSQGFLGYIGYDGVHYLESLPKTTVDDRHLPDIRLQWHAALLQMTAGEYQLFDALQALLPLLCTEDVERLQTAVTRIKTIMEQRIADPASIPPSLSQAGFSSEALVREDVSQDAYEANVRRAKEYIRSGDIFQVVLSKRLRVTRHLHPYVAYDRLRRLNPSPYMFMAEYPDMRLFGASPEVQFRSVAGVAEMKPIAGTSKGRGKTLEEDKALEARLLQDEKERAEHVMLVDLCRNDLGRVCETGSIEVPELMVVEPYSHLFHLVSSVRGRLRQDVSVFEALLSTFPAGTLSGAPKIRAMEIIDELETYRRGPYGGMVGMVDFDANANTAIVIRTVVDANDAYFVQVGAGIVADSDATQEWNECGHKAGAVIDVLSGKSPTKK